MDQDSRHFRFNFLATSLSSGVVFIIMNLVAYRVAGRSRLPKVDKSSGGRNKASKMKESTQQEEFVVVSRTVELD